MSSGSANFQELQNVDTNGALVSVIITCYNQAEFLNEAIQSVLSQTYKNYEIIIVDDGSTDDPKLVAARYPDLCFIQQENQGVAAARNRGWKQSRGTFVVFLDADDRLLPAALEAGRKCFAQQPDAGFVFGGGRLIDSEGNQLETQFLKLSGCNFAQLLEGNSIAFPAQVMYSRTALESVGGFTSFINNRFVGNASDYDLSLRMAHMYPALQYDEVIAEWRHHTTNTSKNAGIMLESCIAVLKAQRSAVRGNPFYEEALRRGLRRVRIHYGEQLIEQLREEARAGKIDWRRFAIGVRSLLKHYPRGLFENAWRKTKIVARRW